MLIAFMHDTVKTASHDPALEGSDDSDDDDYNPTNNATEADQFHNDGDSDVSGSDADVNLAEYDSGDEKTIGASIPSKKRKRTHGKADTEELGSDGGLVKTRSQRAQEQGPEVKSLPVPASSSTAIDAIWASMNSAPSRQPGETPTDTVKGISAAEPETITISRTYKFAGEVQTEEKVVPKDSQSARDYLAAQKSTLPPSLATNIASTSTKPGPPLRRPLKRKSKLEEAHGSNATPKKLNTLEKSRIEWSGFVDDEGINEELKRGNKVGYLDKQDFLGRSEAAQYSSWKAGQKKQ